MVPEPASMAGELRILIHSSAGAHAIPHQSMWERRAAPCARYGLHPKAAY